jgi:hypothetical protein
MHLAMGIIFISPRFVIFSELSQFTVTQYLHLRMELTMLWTVIVDSQYDALPCVASASRVAFICEHCTSCKRPDALTQHTATQELKKV